MSKTYKSVIIEHYQNAWGTVGEEIEFRSGPISDLPKDFVVLEIEPHGDRKMWTYATCCMSQLEDQSPLELHLFSPNRSTEAVEILVATAHYHRTGAELGLGHTVHFGKSWLENSNCEYGLVSLPYLDGPKLQQHELANGNTVSFLWLIPITETERDFKKDHGLEALEARFESSNFDYLDPQRESVC